MLNDQHCYDTTTIASRRIKGRASKVFSSSNNLRLLDLFSVHINAKHLCSDGIRVETRHQVGSQQVTYGTLKLGKFIRRIIMKVRVGLRKPTRGNTGRWATPPRSGRVRRGRVTRIPKELTLRRGPPYRVWWTFAQSQGINIRLNLLPPPPSLAGAFNWIL